MYQASAHDAAVAAGMKVPLPFKLLGKLPHWVRMGSPLADQDTVVNAKQVLPGLPRTGSHTTAALSWSC